MPLEYSHREIEGETLFIPDGNKHEITNSAVRRFFANPNPNLRNGLSQATMD